MLQRVYGFESWHASAPFPCREYKVRVVRLASALGPAVVVDMGCGLGEVVARIPASRRYGFDPSAAAIRGARWLYGRRATFLVGKLCDVDAIRAGISEAQIDLLIMTNWTHGCPIEVIRAQIMALDAILPIRTILMDTVRPYALPGRFIPHSWDDLQTIGKVMKSVDGGDGVRDLHIIALRRQGEIYG
jgi:SAM-dependent methyltransferase